MWTKQIPSTPGYYFVRFFGISQGERDSKPYSNSIVQVLNHEYVVGKKSIFIIGGDKYFYPEEYEHVEFYSEPIKVPE